MFILLSILISICSSYRYYTYKEIITTFDSLAQKHSEIFKLYYPLEGQENLRYLDCGDEECQFFYAEFNNQQAQNDLPTVLIAAGFHGDEVIGQNVVTELAKYLVNDTRLNFLNFRRIILFPMVNPYGYHHYVREEMGIDANRDFNVDNPSRICFQTNAARALAQVYQKYIIQLGITFHGGDNSISYSWGTYNHKTGNRATESPDDNAMARIGQIMRDAALQNTNFNIVQYQLGRMTDEVYAVNGGYEDWAYAASWDSTAVCGNRDPKDYVKSSSNARALTYLIEAGNQKKPKESTLGSVETTDLLLEQWPPLYYYNNSQLKQYTEGYGNINRNLMAAMALIDMSQPYLIVSLQEKEMQLNFGGCYSVSNLIITDFNSSIVANSTKQQGIWDQFSKGYKVEYTNQSALYTIFYQCDSEFKTQRNPDPKLSPQSYFVQSRINQSYEYTWDQFSVQNTYSMSHVINMSELINSERKTLEYHEIMKFDSPFPQMEAETHTDPSKLTQSNKKPYVWWLLTIFILLSIILSTLFYRYCQKKQDEEVMEMNTIQNEDKL